VRGYGGLPGTHGRRRLVSTAGRRPAASGARCDQGSLVRAWWSGPSISRPTQGRHRAWKVYNIVAASRSAWLAAALSSPAAPLPQSSLLPATSDLAPMDSIQFYQPPAVGGTSSRKFSALSGVRGSFSTQQCPPRSGSPDTLKRLYGAPLATREFLTHGAIPAHIGARGPPTNGSTTYDDSCGKRFGAIATEVIDLTSSDDGGVSDLDPVGPFSRS